MGPIVAASLRNGSFWCEGPGRVPRGKFGLVAKCFIINELLKILGAKGAEDYWYFTDSQYVGSQSGYFDENGR